MGLYARYTTLATTEKRECRHLLWLTWLRPITFTVTAASSYWATTLSFTSVGGG